MATPASPELLNALFKAATDAALPGVCIAPHLPDRKSTRLNSSHITISYAVFCLKKKKQKNTYTNKSTHTTI